MCGLTMCVDASEGKCNRGRNEKPEVCWKERGRTCNGEPGPKALPILDSFLAHLLST
jgi:hypothetical protein